MSQVLLVVFGLVIAIKHTVAHIIQADKSRVDTNQLHHVEKHILTCMHNLFTMLIVCLLLLLPIYI